MDTNTTSMAKQIAIWATIFIGTGLIIGGMIYFTKQNEVLSTNAVRDVAIGYAKNIGLNVDQFTKDLDSPELKTKIEQKITEGEAVPIDYTPTFFINGVRIDNPQSFDAFKNVISDALTGKPITPSAAGNVTIKDPIKADDWVRDNKDAKVVVTEYSDFQCPACGAYFPLVTQINQTFGDKIAFVYRAFPLVGIHQYAEFMAIAAEAAGKQGKFWEMYDMIYANQSKWATE